MNKLIIQGSIFFLGVVLISQLRAQDEMHYPYSYKQTVAEGKYIFVMLTKQSFTRTTGANEEDSQVDITYSHSGLYPNNGSLTPVWTVDWYAYKGSVYVSSDGIHTVRVGWPLRRSEPKEELGQLAVGIYAYGNLVKAYRVDDLISNVSSIIYDGDYFEWMKDVSFDDSVSQLTVATLDNEKYVFDITTGEILVKKKNYLNAQ